MKLTSKSVINIFSNKKRTLANLLEYQRDCGLEALDFIRKILQLVHNRVGIAHGLD